MEKCMVMTWKVDRQALIVIRYHQIVQKLND
jgi:hypothetical protein